MIVISIWVKKRESLKEMVDLVMVGKTRAIVQSIIKKWKHAMRVQKV